MQKGRRRYQTNLWGLGVLWGVAWQEIGGVPPSSMGMVNRQAQRCRSTHRHYPDVKHWTAFLGFLNHLWGTVMYAVGGT
jgi:hypothetical protein